MFTTSKLSALLFLLPFAFAAPAADLEARGASATLCGQWDTAVSGNYELLLDQWGLSGASSGSDCASITSLSGSTIAWTTTWKWVGGTGVKSFTNIGLNAGINQQLSAISTIPSTWNWKQTTSGTIVADVAYDMFTANSPGGSATNEIMIWLANIHHNSLSLTCPACTALYTAKFRRGNSNKPGKPQAASKAVIQYKLWSAEKPGKRVKPIRAFHDVNAGPISSSYNSAGQPNPVASGVSLAGHTWNLYSGSNGANAVWSFLPSTAGTEITSFSGDLKTFFTYLIEHEGLSTSQYLTTLQAGTEATSGSATLTTTAYSVVIN